MSILSIVIVFGALPLAVLIGIALVFIPSPIEAAISPTASMLDSMAKRLQQKHLSDEV